MKAFMCLGAGSDVLCTLVKFCMRILGLWTIDLPTKNEEKKEHPAAAFSGIDDSKTPPGIVDMGEIEQEKLHLLGERENGDKSESFRCAWQCCSNLLGNYLWIFISVNTLLFMIYDLSVFITCFWGSVDDVLYLLCYFTYTPQLAAIPFICLFASLYIKWNHPSSLSPACVFTKKYLFENIQMGESCSAVTEVAHFVLMFTWPIVNAGLGFYNSATIELAQSHVPWHMLASRIVAAIAFIQYGCLSYLCFKLRKGFAKRFDEISDEIVQLSEEESKSRICHVYFRFKDFRDFAGYWMTYALPVGVIGLASLITWHFGYVSSARDDDYYPMTTYAIMIWSQKTMFLVQPLVAFYGMNVDYMWDDFKDSVAERLMTAEKVGQTFHRLMRHMMQVNHSPQWMVSTLVFTIVGLYFGMHLQDQNFQYWIGPDCRNEFNMTVNATAAVPRLFLRV